MGIKSLFKYFPPENFLKPSLIGFSFSDSAIRAISVDKNGPVPNLKSVIIPVNDGLIVSGKIKDVDKFAQKLSEAKKVFNSSFVSFAVPDELSYVFSTSIPVNSEANARDSIAFVMEENVPFSLNDVTFDFTPTKIEKSDSEYQASAIVAACVKKETEKFLEALRAGGFEPIGCIHESQAIANAIVPADYADALCAIHAQKNRIGIYLAEKGLISFSTIRSISGNDYEKQFMDEYEKFTEYCSKYMADKDGSIRSALVCGDFNHAKKIIKTMTESENCIKNVSLSNVWTNIFEINKYTPNLPFEESLDFAGAIGAALSDIN